MSFLFILVLSCEKKDKPPDPVTDIGGNTYNTVRIGDQIWMAENLRVNTFNDGTGIPLVTDTLAWGELITPGFCWYGNDEASYKDTYGALYNGYSVSTGKLCPTGWHVPSRDEWQKLRDLLGDTTIGGGKLKEAGTAHWINPNTGADNSSGFTALPAGMRYYEGTFSSVSSFTSYWSATVTENNSGWYFSLYFGDAVARMNTISVKTGFSARCVKD